MKKSYTAIQSPPRLFASAFSFLLMTGSTSGPHGSERRPALPTAGRHESSLHPWFLNFRRCRHDGKSGPRQPDTIDAPSAHVGQSLRGGLPPSSLSKHLRTRRIPLRTIPDISGRHEFCGTAVPAFAGFFCAPRRPGFDVRPPTTSQLPCHSMTNDDSWCRDNRLQHIHDTKRFKSGPPPERYLRYRNPR